MNRAGQSDQEQTPLCLFCGEPEELSISEIWSDHNFQLSTCCPDLLDQVSHEINADPAWGRDLLRRLGAEELTGHFLRRISDGDCGTPMLDCKLTFQDIDHASARAFIARHHGHCSPPRVWRFGTAIMNGWTLLGVVVAGNPVAPALNGTGTVEVNRLCVRRDLDPMLRRDCCSKLYAWSAREAKRRGFGRIITYTRIDELGTSLAAAGWICEGPAGGRLAQQEAVAIERQRLDQESPLVAHSAPEADPAICSVPPAGSAEHFGLGLGGWVSSKQLASSLSHLPNSCSAPPASPLPHFRSRGDESKSNNP